MKREAVLKTKQNNNKQNTATSTLAKDKDNGKQAKMGILCTWCAWTFTTGGWVDAWNTEKMIPVLQEYFVKTAYK